MTTPAFISAIELRVRICGNGLEPAEYSPTYPNNPSAPGGIPTPLPLVTGPNEVAVPAGAVSYMLVPPAGSINAKSVTSTATTSNGVPFTSQVVLLPVAAQSAIWIQSAGDESILVAWF